VFRSHNGHLGLPDEFDASGDIAELSTQQVFHFDAYLFPDDLLAPEVTFIIDNGLVSMPAAGTIRLRPTSASLLANSSSETPSGVPGQLWGNDEDLQQGMITGSFSDGTITFAEGELVYGVTYQVSIYDVDGFQPFEGSYTAGVEADKQFTLSEEITTPLMVLNSNISACTTASSPTDTMAAQVTIQFNHDIEFGTSVYPGGPAEALDDSLFISSTNIDVDGFINSLNSDVSSATQEKGTVVSITGDTLTWYWDASTGLATVDVDDPITAVQWSNLSSITVQEVGRPTSERTLTTLVGTTSISCL
jgi:hypothetical protein